MWVKVDDAFTEHPKVVEAGRHLGKRGRGRVLAIWMVGMCYCNRNLTDGFVDEATVRTWTLFDKHPLDVALVMAAAELMERVEGGFRFHDYHDYQPSAVEVKAKKKKDRDRKREERRRKLLDVTDVVHADTSRTSEGILARSRARDPDLGLSIGTHVEDHRAGARQFSTPVENLRVLKALIWREVHAAFAEGERDIPSVTERCKVVAARAGLVYDVDFFGQHIETAIARVAEQIRRAA